MGAQFEYFYICRVGTIIVKYWEESPLRLIVILALFFRFISVVFSEGYGMHDDHFLVIEAAQSWLDGHDYNNWLPENTTDGRPTGHSFFYPGLHYLFFTFLEAMNIHDPAFKMFLVRLLHALLSILTVIFAYGITETLSGKKDARFVGLLLALYWFFPILSVRNMVEMVCIPFSMLSFWYLIKWEGKSGFLRYILAGVFIGLSIGFRVQMYLFLGGMGLVLLFKREWLGAVLFGLTSLATLFITQAADLFLWGVPFAEMRAYIQYNSTHYLDYITQSPFQYLAVLLGLLIPPVSFFLLWGFFRSWKKYTLLFLPSLIFLVFHSIYPNKQERFILPLIPYIIILGVIGWNEFMRKAAFWANRKKLYRVCITFFVVLNTLALLFVTPASTKKSRVDTMLYLRNLNDVSGLILERSGEYECYLLPRFYQGDWVMPQVCYSMAVSQQLQGQTLKEYLDRLSVNYLLIIEDKDSKIRLDRFKAIYPGLTFVREFRPSYIDRLLHFLNPVNRNETIFLYKLSDQAANV